MISLYNKKVTKMTQLTNIGMGNCGFGFNYSSASAELTVA